MKAGEDGAAQAAGLLAPPTQLPSRSKRRKAVNKRARKRFRWHGSGFVFVP